VLFATGNEQEVSNDKKVVLLNAASPIAIRSHTVSDTDRNSRYNVS